ncbi:MAG: hypothetical protein ACRENJ_08285 [Candidatus Eiseniibacteriota bacterium]
MSLPPILILALSVLAASSAPPSLPRGSDDFRLGMFRAQVDSAVAARKLPVISSGSAFLVCGSDDPAIEYEQYSFFQAPHGVTFLWKVTIGYRLATSQEDLDTVLAELERQLGKPASDTGGAPEAVPGRGTPPQPAARQVIWADARTAVQLGARWGGEHERVADRMMVTWTDRRLQRLVDARRKQGKSEETQ